VLKAKTLRSAQDLIKRRSGGALIQRRGAEFLQHLHQQIVPSQFGSGTEGGSALRTAADCLAVPVVGEAAHAEAVATRDGDRVPEQLQTDGAAEMGVVHSERGLSHRSWGEMHRDSLF